MRRLSLLSRLFSSYSLGLVAFAGSPPIPPPRTPPLRAPTPAPGNDHVDLAVHFAWEPDLIAHHWCKAVAGGFFECLIYANDDPDAPLIGVEEVVDEATYQSFDPVEQQLWHSNVAEAAAGSDPNRPAPSLEEAAAEAEEAGGATYGKLILLGDPETLATCPWARRG